ncbi:unnamed protein product [Leuciscus chuanchicus]
MRPAALNFERGEEAHSTCTATQLEAGGRGQPPLNLERNATQLGPLLNLERGGGGQRPSTWSGGRRPITATQLGAGGRGGGGAATLNLERGGCSRRPATLSGGRGRPPLNLEQVGGGPLNLDRNSTWTATQLRPPLNLDRHSTCSGGRRRPSTWSGGQVAGDPQLGAGGRRPASLNLERGICGRRPSTLSGGSRPASLNLEWGGCGRRPSTLSGREEAHSTCTATQLEAGGRGNRHSSWSGPPLKLDRGGGGRRPSNWSSGRRPATATQL